MLASMGRPTLKPGTHGEIDLKPQHRVEGKWKTHPTGKGKGVERWRARVYWKDLDGRVKELNKFAQRRGDAMQACRAAVAQAIDQASRVGDQTNPDQPFHAAGEAWLALIARTDSGKAQRTVDEYRRAWVRYVEHAEELRGLTLSQANQPARIRAWLQRVADQHGTGAAKTAKTVLAGVLQQAVNDGALTVNGSRSVKPVKAQRERAAGTGKRTQERDTTRALTASERSHLLQVADERAIAAGINPRTRRKREAVANLLHFLAGTGVRISEATGLRWEDVDLDARTVLIRGTKSRAAHRILTLPGRVVDRLSERSDARGGYVFHSPGADAQTRWDQKNGAKALADVFSAAGLAWATPHTLRRTVATILHEASVPSVRIADQLGHADPSMTVRVYLGRDLMGAKDDLAAHL